MTPYLVILDAPALQAAGIQGFAYGFADRVRFYELDALNHVNNTAYLRWFETARVSYMQDYGLSGYSHGPEDPQLVVRHQTAEYFAPMHQNESYVVTARTTLIKSSSFIMDYAVYSGGAMRARGDAVMVSLAPDGSGRRAHKPEAVARMIDRDGAEVAE